MKTRINSNYNKKVLVSGNSLSDVNTLTENEMMLYTKQKDNESVTKVVPSKIITKINGETKSYKVGGTKIIKNVGTSLVTSFRDKDVYPIYIHSVNKLASITKRYNEYSIPIYYDSSLDMPIANLLKKKIKRFYLLFYIPYTAFEGFSLNLTLLEKHRSDINPLLSTILHYQRNPDYNIVYLGNYYTLWEIDITDKKNIIVKEASKRDIAASDYFTLDGTYYFYSPQKHQYLTLDTRFTGDKESNSFYLFEGLVDLDRIYEKGEASPRLYIPIERIRKTNHCIRSLNCDITVPPSEDWREEATSLIDTKLNYRNGSIRGLDSTVALATKLDFSGTVPSLYNSTIYRLKYYEGIEFRLYPGGYSKNYHLNMLKTIEVIRVSGAFPETN